MWMEQLVPVYYNVVLFSGLSLWWRDGTNVSSQMLQQQRWQVINMKTLSHYSHYILPSHTSYQLDNHQATKYENLTTQPQLLLVVASIPHTTSHLALNVLSLDTWIMIGSINTWAVRIICIHLIYKPTPCNTVSGINDKYNKISQIFL